MIDKQNLNEMIEEYTQKYNKFPQKIYGRYTDLSSMIDMCSFVQNFCGKSGYMTSFGVIELGLDPKAARPYLSE